MQPARILALAATLAIPSLALAEQIVWLDFGRTDVGEEKDNQDICDPDGGNPILVMKKGARVGFRPVDIGFPNNNGAADCIDDILTQVRADFEGLNIDFVLEEPAEGTDFTTINIVSGSFPNYCLLIDEDQYLDVDVFSNRADLGGGLFIDICTGKVVDNMGDTVNFDDEGNIADDGMPVCVDTDFFIKRDAALGIAQEIDEGNMNPNKQAWVFVNNHDAGTPQENKIEIGNSISHELAHLLGLEHEDGVEGSIMGALTGANYGTDKDFTMGGEGKGAEDPATRNARRKLEATLPPKEESLPRTRSARTGDADLHGTAVPQGPPATTPGQDAQDKAQSSRQSQMEHIIPMGGDAFIFPEHIQPQPIDPPGIDVPMPPLSSFFYQMPMNQPGLLPGLADAWIEMKILGLNDTDPTGDTKLFIEGFEIPNAFDGIDQLQLTDPLTGEMVSQSKTIWVSDTLDESQLDFILADGFVTIELCVGTGSPFVSVDFVEFTVTDNVVQQIVCFGDCDGSGFIDFNDLVAMLFNFGPATSPECDPDQSGTVDFNDLVAALFLFGPCP